MNYLRCTLILLFFSITFLHSQDFDFNTKLIPEDLKKDANSVIRFENYSIEIKSQRELIFNIESAITIYNKFADNHSDITIHYDKRRSISDVKAYVYDENGNEIKKVRKKDFKDYSASGSNLFSDSRVIHYNHIATTYPYTIYYKYQIKTSNTAFIPGWILNGSYNQSIQKADFEIKYPSDITLLKSEINFEGFKVNKSDEKGLLTYKIENIKAFKPEPNAPNLREYLPYAKFGINKFNLEGVDGEASNWEDFGKWYYANLLQGTQELNEGTKLKIQDLTSKVDDPIEKAKIVYEFVQNKVRYISIQVGIGGFKPMLAGDVDRLSYGDCKALSNYTKALMDAVGVESYYTIIYGGRNKRDIESEFLSVQGNHIVLNLPTNNGDLWLECTNQKVPFGYLGDFTDDRDALVIKPEGGVIKHTKNYNAEENLQLTTGSFLIDNDGGIKANLVIESSGTQYDDNLMRNDGESHKDLDLLFKNYLSNINNIEFSTIEIFNNKKEEKFEEELVFKASNYATITNNQLLIPINAFNNISNVPKRVRNRKLPVTITRGFLDVDEVKIQLPLAMKIDYLPENVELKTEFGTYTIEVKRVDANNLIFKRKLSILKGTYPKEDYELYRSFWKSIRKYDNSKIVLIK